MERKAARLRVWKKSTWQRRGWWRSNKTRQKRVDEHNGSDKKWSGLAVLFLLHTLTAVDFFLHLHPFHSFLSLRRVFLLLGCSFIKTPRVFYLCYDDPFPCFLRDIDSRMGELMNRRSIASSKKDLGKLLRGESRCRAKGYKVDSFKEWEKIRKSGKERMQGRHLQRL